MAGAGAIIHAYREEHRLDVLARENADLKSQNAHLTELVSKRDTGDAEVAKTRIAIHAASFVTLYSMGAAALPGPFFDHPGLAMSLISLNFLIFVLSQALIRFG